MVDIELARMLAARSAKRGDFTLASGRKSNLYIDARLTTMSPDGLALIGRLGHDIVVSEFPMAGAVGGLTLGADPIAYAIAYCSAASAKPLRAFTVRKEAKGHGTGRLIEGPLLPHDLVVVIEDVITTGGSALRAIEALQAFPATVLGVIAVVDRQEGGRQAIEQAGVRVIALAAASDIVPLIP